MEKDPWYWTVDEVIQNLFGENGLLLEFSFAGDVISHITDLIRESDTDGCELLLSTYDPTNPQEGLHRLKWSQWRKLEIAIEKLRFRSIKYIQYLRDKEQHAAHFEPFSAIRDSLGHQKAIQRAPTTSRASSTTIKVEQYKSDYSSITPSGTRASGSFTSPAHQSTAYLLVTDQQPILLETGDTTSAQDQSLVLPQHSTPTLTRLRSDGSSAEHTENKSLANSPVCAVGTELPRENGVLSEARLRENEIFVVDGHGRKRRKLQIAPQDHLDPLLSPQKSTKDPNLSNGMKKDQDVSVEPTHIVDDRVSDPSGDHKENPSDQSSIKTDFSRGLQEINNPHAASEPQQTVAEPLSEFVEPIVEPGGVSSFVSSPPYSPKDKLIDLHPIPEIQTTDAEPLHGNPLKFVRAVETDHQEPVEAISAANGGPEDRPLAESQRMKKRIQPQLIGPIITQSQQEAEHIQPLRSKNIDTNSLRNSSDDEEPLTVSKVQGHSEKVLQSRHNYLGSALPVDWIFYGNTKVGEVITYDMVEIGPQLAKFDPDTDEFSFVSSDSLPIGQRLVVAHLLQSFLRGDNVQSLVYGKKRLTAVVPYHARICKRYQQPSLTLLSRSDNSIIARRVNRAQWLKHNLARRVPVSSQDQNSQTLEFDVGQEESPLLSIGRDEVHDYDFLEKWQHQADNRILPTYGDSGSEGEYDLDTWNEMELEKGALEQVSAPPSKKPVLDAEHSDRIVQEVETAFIGWWRLRKFPKLESKAWSLWKRSRRQHIYRDQLVTLTNEVKRLDIQFLKIKKEILKERWSSESRLKAQCKSFAVSVSDRETCRWKIDVLKSSSAPQKPPPSQKPLQKAPSLSQESLQDGEEDIGSSSMESLNDNLDDFISQDETSEHDDANDVDSEDNVELFSGAAELRAGSQPAEIADIASPNGEKGESPASRRSIVFRRKAPRLEDETMDLGQLGAISGSSVPKAEKLSTDSADTSTKKVDSSEPVVPSREPDVIDLTSLSDSEEQALQPFQQGKRVATPPVFVKSEADDPFSRPANPKSGFRMPPVSSSIYDHENGTETTTAKMQIPKEISERLPSLNEVKQIAKLDPEFLKRIIDRDRLLIWMIHRAGDSQRDGVFQLIKKQNPYLEILQFHVWEGMVAIEKGTDLPDDLTWDEMSSDRAQAYMRLAAWYVCWSQCSIAFPEGSSQVTPAFPKQDVVKAIEDISKNFVPFLDTLKAIFPSYVEKKKSQSTLLGSSPSSSKKKKKRVRRVTSGSEDSEDKKTNKRKKRVYEVAESQQALELQRTGKMRIEEQQQRQKEMDKRMRQMGVTSDDTSAKIINIGANQDQEMIVISSHITSRIQAHQLDGVRFLWREVVAANQGCLLAHTMGLGKTMQVITLLVTIAEAAKSKDRSIRDQIPKNLGSSKTLILSPPTLVDNWNDEFLMWAPEPRSENVGDIWKVSSDLKSEERLGVIKLWDENGGVLILGYEAFRILINNPKRGKAGSEKVAPMDEERHQALLEILLNRPNIIVVDEAHTIKNPTSAISKAVARFKTKNRVALTGSPLSNNLEEYYSLISWTAPGYLGERHEFRAKYGEPIAAGLYEESTAYEKRNCLKKLSLLSRQLEPKMQRQDVSVLKKQLSKSEFVIYVPLTEIQRQAYELYANSLLSTTGGKNPPPSRIWGALSVLRLLCNHPKCFKDKLTEAKEHQSSSKTKEINLVLEKVADEAIEDEDGLIIEDAMDTVDAVVPNIGLTEEMVNQQLNILRSIKGSIERVDLSNKMLVLMRIIAFSEEAQEKVLVFSHSISTLDFIGDTLNTKGHKYARLDGATPMQKRNQLTKRFNTGKSTKICLISTRAGGQGLNLFGASRVVIVDDFFNPMHEEQAIGRAYRIGQEKHVFVYRLTIGGTFEETIQNQSLFKVQLATRVVDKKHNSRYALGSLREYLRIPEELPQKDLSSLQGKDASSVIRSILPSETFKDLEPLTAEEEMEVEENLRLENLRKSDPQTYYIEYAKHEHALQQKAFSDIRAQDQAEFNREIPTASHALDVHNTMIDQSSAPLNGYAPHMFPRNSTDHLAKQVKDMRLVQPEEPRSSHSSSLNNLKPGLDLNNLPGDSAFVGGTQGRVGRASEMELEAVRNGTRIPPKEWRPDAKSPFTLAFIDYLRSPGVDVSSEQAQAFLAFADSEAYKQLQAANFSRLPQQRHDSLNDTLSEIPLSVSRQDEPILKDVEAGPSNTQSTEKVMLRHSPSLSVASKQSESSARRLSEASLMKRKSATLGVTEEQREHYRDRICRRIMRRFPDLVLKGIITADNAKELCQHLAIRFERTAKHKAASSRESYRRGIHEIEEWIEDDEKLGKFLHSEKKQAKPPAISPTQTRHNTPEASEAKRLASSPLQLKIKKLKVKKEFLQSPELLEGTRRGLSSTGIAPPSPRPRRVESTPLSELHQTTPSLPDIAVETRGLANSLDGARDEKAPPSESTARNDNTTISGKTVGKSVTKLGHCNQQ